MDSGSVHRELLLPSPTKDPPEIAPLVWTTGDLFCLEIHREKDGRVRYALGSEGTLELDALVSTLESARPRLAGGNPIDCLVSTEIPGWTLRACRPHPQAPPPANPERDTA